MMLDKMPVAVNNRRDISVTTAVLCYAIHCLFLPLNFLGQEKSIVESQGVSVGVPETWKRITDNAQRSPNSFDGRPSIEPLIRLRKSGKYEMSPSLQVTVIQERWSLDEMKAHHGAEILEASKPKGIKIDQLIDEIRTFGNNRGYFVEYRATYPNEVGPVKHAMFTIPGPAAQTVVLAAVSLEEDFEELRADCEAIFSSVTIGWAQLPRKPPPRRGIGFGVALGVLLGSLYWLLMRQRRGLGSKR
jgi:hypothetical protein